MARPNYKSCLYLVQYIQGDGVEEVFHYDSEDRALAGCSYDATCVCGNGHTSHPTSMQCIDCLQSCLGTLRRNDRNCLEWMEKIMQ